MRPDRLEWSWRDWFRIGRWAFSDRKIALHARGLLRVYLVLVLLRYLLGRIGGLGWAEMVRTWGFSISVVPTNAGTAASVAWFRAAAILALLVLVYEWLWRGIAVAKLTFEQLRGEIFYPLSEARDRALQNRGAVYWALLVMAAIFLAVILCAAVAGLLIRLPGVGKAVTVLVALLAIPAFFVGALWALLGVTIVYGLLLLPSIAGVTGGNASEVAYQLVVLTWREGWRIAWYYVTVLGVVLLSVAGFLVLAVGGWTVLMGYIAEVAPTFGRVWAIGTALVLGGSLGGGLLNLGWVEAIAAVLIALATLFVTLVGLGYVLSIGSTAGTVFYIHLRRRIWDENVLEIAAEAEASHKDAESEALKRTSD